MAESQQNTTTDLKQRLVNLASRETKSQPIPLPGYLITLFGDILCFTAPGFEFLPDESI